MDQSKSQAPTTQWATQLRAGSQRWAALLIAGLGAAVALAARATWSFDGLYGQDAFAYFRYARALWPWLLRGEPLPIYYWPAGYPLLVALALPFTGWSSAGGQAVSIVAGAGAAGLTYLLSRELLPDAPSGPIAAWVAGLAVALSGAVLRANLVVMSDALAMGCCAAAIWSLACYTRTRRWPWLAGAAVALAWAIITRWVCGLLAIPMLVFVLLAEWTRDEGRRMKVSGASWPPFHPSATSIRLPSFVSRLPALVRHGAGAFALGALILVPQLLVSQTTPAALSEHQWVVSWNIANIWRRDFTTVDGTQHYALPVGAFYLAQMAWPSFVFPLLALMCVPGAFSLARGRRWAVLALLSGWPLLLWLFLSGIPYENSRFVLPALPALAALAGLGFAWAYASAGRWRRGALLIALAAALAGGLAWGLRDYRKLVDYKNDQLALVDWVRARLPSGSTLITFGTTLTLQHYSDYDVRELFYLDRPDLDVIAQQRRPIYLLLDIGNAESQWARLLPQQDYDYLRQKPGLQIVDRRAPYTLFRLKTSGYP